jgi:hypothetical protein
MSNYQVKVIDMTVHRWCDTHGQGEFVCCKGGFTLGEYKSVADAKIGLNKWFDYKLDTESYDGEHVHASLIEDVEGYATPNGDFITDYFMEVIKCDRVNFDKVTS